MITKEQYLQALEQHFKAKKIIDAYNSQINQSMSEIIDEKQAKQYPKDANLLSLLIIEYGKPNNVFKAVTRNKIGKITKSEYHQPKYYLFDEQSTVNDLIKAYHNRDLHKQSGFGKVILTEIKTFIETQVI